MGGIVSRKRNDSIHPIPALTPTNGVATTFANIFSQKDEVTSLYGSIYASYLPSPLLCLRTFHNYNPSLELTDSLLYKSHRFSLLVIKIKFKYYGGHKKNIPLYYQTLNGFISSIIDYITLKWGGFIWKIEDSERIYCLFGDLSLSDEIEEDEYFANQKSTISVRNAVLCAHELSKEYNLYTDDQLGIQFSLHFLVSHGKEIFFFHCGGLHDKWFPLLLIDQNQNSKVHFLLPSSRRGQILISNEAFGYIKNDYKSLTEDQCNDPKYKERILLEKQMGLRNQRFADKQISKVQQTQKNTYDSWIGNNETNNSLLSKDASPTKGFLNSPTLEDSPEFNRAPNLNILKQDDLDSVFDSEEEREFYERQLNDNNENTEIKTQISRFICRSKHDAWILQDVYYDYFDLKKEIYSQGFLPYLTTQYQFLDKQTYQGYLSDIQISLIENNLLKTPQQMYASILTISLPFSRIQDSDIQNLQKSSTIIQRNLIKNNGFVYDIGLDSQYRIVITAVFGLIIPSSDIITDNQLRSETAVNAVQSAISIFQKLDNLGEKNILIGISSGFLYTWSLGSSMRKSFSILGDIINLSKELHKHIQIHGILVDHSTFTLSNTSVSYYESMKVIKRKESEIFVHTPSVVGFNQIVSREYEINEIWSTLENMLDGTTSFKSLILKSELGPGKSIILHRIVSKARSKNRPVLFIEGYNLSHIPFYPFLNLFRKIFGLPSNDITPYQAHINSQLEKLIPYIGNQKFIFNSVLSVNFQKDPTLSLRGDELRQFIIQVFTDLIGQYTKKQPTILVVHRAHLLDSMSIELMSSIFKKLKNLIIVESFESWERLDHYITNVHGDSEVNSDSTNFEKDYPNIKIWDLLSDLDQQHTKTLICSLLKCRECSENIVSYIHNTSNGNPIFIKDLTLLLNSLEMVKVLDNLSANLQKNTTIEDLKKLPTSLSEIMLKRFSLLGDLRKKILKYLSICPSPLTYKMLSELPQLQSHTNQITSVLKDLEGGKFIKSSWSDSQEFVYTLDNEIFRQTIQQAILKEDKLNINKELAMYYIQKMKDEKVIQIELSSKAAYHIYNSMKDGLEDASLLLQGVIYFTTLGNYFLELNLIKEGLQRFQMAKDIIEALNDIEKSGIRQVFNFSVIPEHNLTVSYGLLRSLFLSSPISMEGRNYAQKLLNSSKSYEHIVHSAISLCFSYLYSHDLDQSREYIHKARDTAETSNNVELSLLGGSAMAFYQLSTGKLQQSVDSSKYVMQVYQKNQHSNLYLDFPIQSDVFTLCVSLSALSSTLLGNFDRTISLFNQVSHEYPDITPSQQIPFVLLCLSVCIVPMNLSKVEIWLEKFTDTKLINPFWNLKKVVEFIRYYIQSKKSNNEEYIDKMQNILQMLTEDDSKKLSFIYPLLVNIFLEAIKETMISNEIMNIIRIAKPICSKYPFIMPQFLIYEGYIKEKLYKYMFSNQSNSLFIYQSLLQISLQTAINQKEWGLALQCYVKLYKLIQSENLESKKLFKQEIEEKKLIISQKLKSHSQKIEDIQNLLNPLKLKQSELLQSKKNIIKKIQSLQSIFERLQKVAQSLQKSIEDKKNHPSNLKAKQAISALQELSKETIYSFTSMKPSESTTYLSQAITILTTKSKSLDQQFGSTLNQIGQSPQISRERSWDNLKNIINENFTLISDLDVQKIATLKADRASSFISKIQIEDLRKSGDIAILLLNWATAFIDVLGNQKQILTMIQEVEKESKRGDSIGKQISLLRNELLDINKQIEYIDSEIDPFVNKMNDQIIPESNLKNELDYYNDYEISLNLNATPLTLEVIKTNIGDILKKIEVGLDNNISFLNEAKSIILE